MKYIKAFLATIIAIVVIICSVLCYFRIQTLIYPKDYEEYVSKYSNEFNVKTELVFSVIKCESSFNKDAVSNIGAIGLMQLVPDTFEWLETKLDGKVVYSSDDLYNPEINIKYGTYLLSVLLNEYSDTKTALAAYHAGMGNVDKWLKDSNYSENGKTLVDTPFKETNAYMERVVNVMKTYEFMLSTPYVTKLYKT